LINLKRKKKNLKEILKNQEPLKLQMQVERMLLTTIKTNVNVLLNLADLELLEQTIMQVDLRKSL
jgi:hypothetical protein